MEKVYDIESKYVKKLLNLNIILIEEKVSFFTFLLYLYSIWYGVMLKRIYIYILRVDLKIIVTFFLFL